MVDLLTLRIRNRCGQNYKEARVRKRGWRGGSTWGVELQGQPKIRKLHGRGGRGCGKENVLRLEIPVNHPHLVTELQHFHQAFEKLRGFCLGVAFPLHNPVEELAAFTQLHDEMHAGLVFEDIHQLHDVGMAREEAHDLNLASHVLDILDAEEVGFGDGLTSKRQAGAPVCASASDAELPATKLGAEKVMESSSSSSSSGPRIR